MRPLHAVPLEDPLPPRPEVLLWNDRVHERDESSQLYFWRLSFAPDYNRDSIFASLGTFYEQAGITAYVAYETLGDFDLLLRLWVPRRFIPDEIENLLRDILRADSLWDVNYLACRTDLHHAGLPRTSFALENAPALVSDAMVSSINDFNRRQMDGELVVRPPGASSLLQQGVLIPVRLDTRGIRFYIVFDRPHRATPAARKEILRRLLEKCESLRSEWAALLPDGPPSQISVYSGAGTMSDYLVLARAPHGHFHNFVRAMVIGLRAIGLEQYQMRPYTYVLADEMFSGFQEQRTTVASAGFSEEQLFAPEDSSLELKATFATNLRRLRHEGPHAPDKSVVRGLRG